MGFNSAFKGLISGIISDSAWRIWEKSWKSSLSTDGVQAEKWIQNLLSTKRRSGSKYHESLRHIFLTLDFVSTIDREWRKSLCDGLLRKLCTSKYTHICITRLAYLASSLIATRLTTTHTVGVKAVQKYQLTWKEISLPKCNPPIAYTYRVEINHFLCNILTLFHERPMSNNFSGRWRPHRRETTLACGHRQWYWIWEVLLQRWAKVSQLYVPRMYTGCLRAGVEKRINWTRLSLHAMCIRLAAADSTRNAWAFCAASFGIYARYSLLLISFLFPLSIPFFRPRFQVLEKKNSCKIMKYGKNMLSLIIY